MKKILVVFLTLALVFGMAACGSNGDKGSEDEELTVGFIYIGSKNDGGFSEAQHEATMAMEEHFAGKVKTIITEEVDDTNKQAALDAATNMIDSGADVIVGCSFGFMDALDELANSGDYDDIKFLHFSGYKMNDTNFGNYFGATEEPRYLTGIIAGLQTETNKLGYVAAHNITEVQIGINAFTLGAQSVNPDVDVKVVFINSWYDPAQEKQAAEALLEQGCDVIAQHSDTPGPQEAAQAAGAYAIGYNLDNSGLEGVEDAYLTSPIWHHEVFLIPTIQAIMDGEWTPESYYGTIADGYMDIAPMTDLVPKDTQDKVNEVMDKMKAGEFPVFVGPIEDNKGNIVVKEGETLDREAIWKIDYLIKGVSAIK